MTQVSVIVPTYNRPDLLEKTLQSIIDQAYQDFEVLIVNDGGSDQAEKIVNRLSDPRLKYYKKRNEGASATRNFAINKAQGDYIAFCDDDDLWLPEKLARQIKEMIEKKFKASLTGYYLDKPHINNACIYKKDLVIPLFNDAPCSVLAVHQEVLRKVGMFNPNLPVAVDRDLYIRIFAQYDFLNIPAPLVIMKGYDENHSRLTGNYKRIFKYNYQVIEENLLKITTEHPNRIPRNTARQIKSLWEFKRAKIDFFEKKYGQAAKNFVHSIRLSPVNWEAWLFLPFCLLGANFFEKLIPLYEKIFKRKYIKYF